MTARLASSTSDRLPIARIVGRRSILVLQTVAVVAVLTVLSAFLAVQLLVFGVMMAGIVAGILVGVAGLGLGLVGHPIHDPGNAIGIIQVGILVCFGGYRLGVQRRRRERVPSVLRELIEEFRVSWRRAASPPMPEAIAASRTLVAASQSTPAVRPAPVSLPRPVPTPGARTSPICAHRAWKIVFVGQGDSWYPALGSVTMDTIWTTAVQTAACGNRHGPAPEPACTCGIYALKPNVPTPPYARQGWWADGEVELTGLVVEAQLGYRAAEARLVGPLVLHAPADAARDPVAVAARLELRYGVTVHWKGEAR